MRLYVYLDESGSIHKNSNTKYFAVGGYFTFEKYRLKITSLYKKINKLVKDFVELKEITRTMLVSLVDRIEVSEDKEITIYYKFNILNMRKVNDEEELINVG